MSLGEIDPVLQPPKRLAIIALLNSADIVEFRLLRDHLDLADSDLSKQMSALGEASYVSVTKTRPGRGGTTIYRITRQGRRAFAAHRAALEALIEPAVPVESAVPASD